jgi:DNA polymerase (family 10)/putative hydrolase
MKTWEKYRKYLMKGEWHVHTNYTDGNNTIFEYCQKAVQHNIPLIVFTEHVRKKLDYDFGSFLREIEKTREMFPELIILSGLEAKVLETGELDVEEKLLKKVDYPIFAYHTFPASKNIYLETIQKVIKNRYVNTWCHPGLFLVKNHIKIKEEELIKILENMKTHRVLLELNKKYNLPDASWIKKAKEKKVLLVNGGDIHSIIDLKRREKND